MSVERPWRLLATVLVLALLAWQGWPRLQGIDADTRVGTAITRGEAVVPAATPATEAHSGARLPGFLPPEAGPVIANILRGGHFPHRQDGSVFGNREGRLPARPRGYYREYTVPTPGLGHRGLRRIVTGGDPPREWYYTADHYESFKAFTPPEDLQ